MPEEKGTLAAATDEELAAEFQQGKIEAFNLLVGRYKHALVNYVYRYLGDYDGADDIVQETFVRVYNHIDSYKPVAKFSTWIYTIATNLARTQYRRQQRWGFFGINKSNLDEREEVQFPDQEVLPDEIAGNAILHEHVEEALSKLPAPFREIVILFSIEEKSYEEICEITGQNMGTVKSRLNRGRAKLRELLSDVMNEEKS